MRKPHLLRSFGIYGRHNMNGSPSLVSSCGVYINSNNPTALVGVGTPLPTLDSIKVQRYLFNCGPCLHRLIEIEFAPAALDLMVVPRRRLTNASRCSSSMTRRMDSSTARRSNWRAESGRRESSGFRSL
jgi:hypothetical protein